MNKLSVINDFLQNKNVDIEIILNELQIHRYKDIMVIFYISSLEGLGTDFSDLDVYIIYEPNEENSAILRKLEFCEERIRKIGINDLSCDIEYWQKYEINKLLEKINVTHGYGENRNLLTIIQRLSYGYLAYSDEQNDEIYKKILSLNINELVKNNYLCTARAYYEDALVLFKSNEYYSALDCCEVALLDAIGAYNAICGCPNLKFKWITKIFLKNNGYDNKLIMKKFMKFHLSVSEKQKEIDIFIEEYLKYIQEILLEIDLL